MPDAKDLETKSAADIVWEAKWDIDDAIGWMNMEQFTDAGRAKREHEVLKKLVRAQGLLASIKT